MGRWLKILELKIQKCRHLYVTLDHRSWFNGVKNDDNYVALDHRSWFINDVKNVDNVWNG